MAWKALVVGNDAKGYRSVLDALSRNGIQGAVESDPDAALQSCASNAPDLVIVDEHLGGMTGIRFLSKLVTVAWTTSTILVADEDEEVIHDKTEGLGILGSIRNVEDSKNLERLLDRFIEMKQ